MLSEGLREEDVRKSWEKCGDLWKGSADTEPRSKTGWLFRRLARKSTGNSSLKIQAELWQASFSTNSQGSQQQQ
jgi:hypothetical protein